MAELLKNIYNKGFFDGLILNLESVIDNFSKELFLEKIFNDEWEQKELKQRMRHLSTVLKDFLPQNYVESIDIILKLVNLSKQNQHGLSLEYMFIPDFVEQFGLDDLQTSIKAFENITQFTSCEFAVRPFILKFPERMMNQMLLWSEHNHQNVRRFSSEGCRPRLPWAMALPFLKKDPTPIISILENLKNDDSEFVRKSVANNLNDISKDNPKLVIEVAKNWKNTSKNTDWIIKHGCRTLLKQGNSEVMNLFGFGTIEKINIEEFEVLTSQVNIGNALHFRFKLKNSDTQKVKIRLEYGLYYQKANGSLSKKVFKINEKEYGEKSITEINRKQSFRVITTRKFYCGIHKVSLIINGNEMNIKSFMLLP